MEDQTLKELKDLLEDIKEIMLVVNRETIEKNINQIIKSGSVEEKVYKLCDGKRTTEDIATKIQKSEKNVSGVLSTLRKKGLIKTFQKDEKTVYDQRFRG